jgi:hypothetical protein
MILTFNPTFSSSRCILMWSGRKVQRAEGRDIGLDRPFTYYRYTSQPRPMTLQQLWDTTPDHRELHGLPPNVGEVNEIDVRPVREPATRDDHLNGLDFPVHRQTHKRTQH